MTDVQKFIVHRLLLDAVGTIKLANLAAKRYLTSFTVSYDDSDYLSTCSLTA